MSESYNQGGVIPGNGESVPVKINVGERVITADGVVYELQEVGDGYQWVLIGEGYELLRSQARAEDGEALREVLMMLAGRMLSPGGSS